MSDAPVTAVDARAYEIPCEQPESYGTMEWDSVTVVVAEVTAGDCTGLGYTYGAGAIASLITGPLGAAVAGRDALAVPAAWWAMVGAVRNIGWPGVAAMAISAVDVALWDLKAKLLRVSLADLLGRARDAVPVYGSGGLTSYTEAELCRQLAAWVGEGIPRVKMKIGRDPSADPARVRAARDAIGPEAELFVDANGAYSRQQALALADAFAEAGVSWFEEPVSSNDLDGLAFIRAGAPAGMDITAGEYGFTPEYFRAMAGSVDVLQADVTRCGGISGLQAVGDLCTAFELPFSAHCAPQIHAHAGASIGRLRHCEYFHTHARAEQILFDGVLRPAGDGCLHPDAGRPGLGIELRRADIQEFAL